MTRPSINDYWFIGLCYEMMHGMWYKTTFCYHDNIIDVDTFNLLGNIDHVNHTYISIFHSVTNVSHSCMIIIWCTFIVIFMTLITKAISPCAFHHRDKRSEDVLLFAMYLLQVYRSYVSKGTDQYMRLISLVRAGDIELNPGPGLANVSSCFQDVSLCHANIQSLRSNPDKFEHIKLQLSDNYDIITLSETWLSDNIPDEKYDLPNFQPIFRRDRPAESIGGGVAAWVSSSIATKRINHLEMVDMEAMWLEIRCHNNKFMLCIVYKPPNQSVQFWENLQDMLDSSRTLGIDNVVFVGDFNAHDDTYHGNHFKFFVEVNNLTSHINEPTRFTASSQTNLDRIVTNIPQFVKQSEVLAPLYTNDHCTLSLSLLFRTRMGQAYTRTM